MNNVNNEKYELYEQLEELVAIKLNSYEFVQFGYILEQRNIAWGDTTRFKVEGKDVNVELKTYKTDFSDLLNLEVEEMAEKLTYRIINEIIELIKLQIESCAISTSLKNFNHIIKLILEGTYICIDDKFVYKIGIGTIV